MLPDGTTCEERKPKSASFGKKKNGKVILPDMGDSTMFPDL